MRVLECVYRHNTNARMTAECFAEWLKAFDRRMRRLRKKKVLLILNNLSGHKASRMKDLPELQHTELLYLPTNTISNIQPLDAGIIRNFKLYYHKRLNRYMLRRLEMLDVVRVRGVIDTAIGLNRREPPMEKPEQPTYINLRSAIDLQVSAWNDVTPQTIHNCFRHCDIRTTSADSSDNEQVKSSSETELDQGAIKDLENSNEVLFSKRPELFSHHLDIQSLLNNVDEDIVGFNEDESLDENQLLKVEDDELPPPEDDSEVAPKITRQEAMASLLCLGMYLQQQDEDMGPEQAMVRRVLDQVESKRIFQLQQTSIQTYFH